MTIDSKKIKPILGLLAIIVVVAFVAILLKLERFEEVGAESSPITSANVLNSNTIPVMGGGAQLYHRPCLVPLSKDQVRSYQNIDIPLPINVANKAKFPAPWKQFYNTASGFGPQSCMLPADAYDVTYDTAGCSEANANLFNPEIVAKVFPLTDNAQNRCVIHFKPQVADDQMHNYISALKSVRDGREKVNNAGVYIPRVTAGYANNKVFQIQNYADIYERPHTEFNLTFTAWVRITQRDGQKWSHIFGTSDNAPYMRAPTLWIHPDKPQLQMTVSRLQNYQLVHNLPDMSTSDTTNTLSEARTHARNWMFLHHTIKATSAGRHMVSTTVYTFDVMGNQIHVTPPLAEEIDDLLLSNQKRKANNIDGEIERHYIFNRAQWWNNGRGFQVHDVRVTPTLMESQQDLDKLVQSGLQDLTMETEATGGRIMPIPYAIQTAPAPAGEDAIILPSYSYSDWWQNHDLIRDILEGLLIPNPLYNSSMPENATDNVKYYVKRVRFIAYLGNLYEIKATSPATWPADGTIPPSTPATITLANVSDPAEGVPQTLTHGKEVKTILGFVERPRLPLQVPQSLELQI